MPRWARWTGGCLLALVVAPFAIVLWFKWLFLPTVTARVEAPEGPWTARLEHPTGSMEPGFYSVWARKGFWPFATDCQLGQIYGWNAEQSVRLSWTGRDTLLIRYGLSRYDRERAGIPVVGGLPEGCADVRAVARRDPALDAAATEANDNNGRFDNPEPPDLFANVTGV